MTHSQLEEAYRTYGHLVARRCRRILRDPTAAEDVVQEVFVRLWRHGDAFLVAESKVAWLYRVADRCCFDALARTKARVETSLHEAPEAVTAAGQVSQPLEDREVILRFLGRFDDRVKQVALLYYLDQLSQEEIAMHTGWSRQTVLKKLAYLRERASVLRAQLCGGEEVR
ncbi:MAG TPA: sigma-70 family RNA polymerase sigma factor [Polyangia bacterium]|jgi:RNA polymerase sigma-70 factor (ECF subfamily)|nr:sigma-70 family RNA polymerase sigma factor [Polyangia bacterium]